MDPIVPSSVQPVGICSVCHQPLLSTYYFCPNCGTKVSQPPLSTTPLSQAGLYAFSIILPMICFVAVTKWQGLTYLRSNDERAKQVGAIACGLLLLSTVVTVYYAYVWTEEALQQATAQVNQEDQEIGL